MDEEHAEALREDWARGRVAAAGKSWVTHLAKFDGTVLPRGREVVARSETPSDAANRMSHTLGRALRPPVTQDGIRPHLPMTPEELAERERVMLRQPITPLGPLDL